MLYLKNEKNFIVLILLLLLFTLLGMSPRQEKIRRNIRILLENNVHSIKLSGLILNVYDEKGILLRKVNGPVWVSEQSDGVTLNRIHTKRNIIQFQSQRDILEIGENEYRGRVIIKKNDNKKGIEVINDLPLEEYLKGVIPAEMDTQAPLEALKAQAVAARTYAYYYMRQNKDKSYDMELPQNTQAYKGLKLETEITNKAIEETKGMILKYENDVYPAFFHAKCGGFTIQASKVWPKTEDMTSEVYCKPCSLKKTNEWSYTIKISDLRKKIEKCGYSIPVQSKIIFYRNSHTNRVENFRIGDQTISAAVLRKIVGPNQLKSTIFETSVDGSTIRFYGKGWGHGVGLCQSGAIELAKEGKSYKRILMYYYPKGRLIRTG